MLQFMSPGVGHENLVIFGKYELLECLGGGMADVYRARDRVTGKTVAIKILKREHSADEQMKARFLDEARTAAPLEHRHIIHVFDFGEVADRPYMVMEFLRGQDPAERDPERVHRQPGRETSDCAADRGSDSIHPFEWNCSSRHQTGKYPHRHVRSRPFDRFRNREVPGVFTEDPTRVRRRCPGVYGARVTHRQQHKAAADGTSMRLAWYSPSCLPEYGR